jgi:hypothetical protein
MGWFHPHPYPAGAIPTQDPHTNSLLNYHQYHEMAMVAFAEVATPVELKEFMLSWAIMR